MSSTVLRLLKGCDLTVISFCPPIVDPQCGANRLEEDEAGEVIKLVKEGRHRLPPGYLLADNRLTSLAGRGYQEGECLCRGIAGKLNIQRQQLHILLC